MSWPQVGPKLAPKHVMMAQVGPKLAPKYAMLALWFTMVYQKYINNGNQWKTKLAPMIYQ